MLKENKTEMEMRQRVINAVIDYYKFKFEKENKFSPGNRINYAGRVFDHKEMTNLVDASLDFWLTEGRFAEEFTANLADYLDVETAMLVNSGSSANLIALSSLTSPKLKDRAIKQGDEVITVAAGFPTTVNPIFQNKATPVFIDVELGTYVPKIEMIDKAITPKTKAIMLAHTMGVPFDAVSLRELCDQNGLWLIEDCCDALGSKIGEKYLGTFGDLATYSFYPAHQITMGEGGAVVTNNDQLAKIGMSFRDWGRDCYCSGGENNTCGKRFTQQFGTLPYGYDHKYVYSHIGYNLKVTDMQAAIGCAQLEKLENFVEDRRRNWETLRDGLLPFEDRMILPETPLHTRPCYFGFVITVRKGSGVSRNEVTGYLEDAGIETRNLFCGNLTRHPAYQGTDFKVVGSLHNTDTVMNDTFFIGVYPGLKKDHLLYVIEKLDRPFTKAK